MKSLKRSSFPAFLTLSVFLHVGLTFTAVLFSHSFFLSSKKKDLLLEASIQVDSISLSELKKLSPIHQKKKSNPKATQKKLSLQKKPPPVKKSSLPEPKTKKPKTEPQLEDKKEEELEKTDNQDPIREEPLEELTKQEPEESNSSQETNDDQEISENQISELSYYARQITDQTKRNWKLPSYLTNEDITTQIEIKINSEGILIYKEILSSSGNELYDSFVLKAIERASPYPKPLPSIQKIIEGGVVLNMSSQ